MCGFKAFAVAGAGDIGRFILEELVRHVADDSVTTIVALTRSSTGYDDLEAKGIVFKTVDYSEPTTLVSALQGIDVVISAITHNALPAEFPLADAAKASRVKHFVLSEYGNPSNGKTYGMFELKNRVRQYLIALDLPYSQFFTGIFPDWWFDHRPEWGFDLPNGKAVVGGSGNVPISWTARPDIARYMVYILTHLSPAEQRNKAFAMEGERKTINQVLEEYQARTGKQLEITYESKEFLEKQVKEHPDDFENGLVRMLRLEFERGEGQTGSPEEVNKYWPDFKPAKVIDVIPSL
ncbi:NADP-binding protein [Dacryopinax primogenitus]|uniref:NADP-binding protein n=1 Tax=Dacryopinax primogenitus (strain DJM 731) TaxID=1858805 RepID=M5GBB6_DACPD|nr:NADP-binding protein [Dacryopinax primogenitus]EJU01278.1 NADP-binding protein [Dacryopinax primogenitus]